MLFSGFSIMKFLSGFALWKGDKIGKWAIQIFWIVVVLAVFYKVFLMPMKKSVTQQKAETIVNHYTVIYMDKENFFAGIKLGGFRLGGSHVTPMVKKED